MSLSHVAEQPRSIPKLSEVLFEEPSRNFATIAALPSNVEAIEAALLFAIGSLSFLALVGPSGWGKSHMLEAVACRMGHDAGAPPRIYSAKEWLFSGARRDTPGSLLLDNVQDVFSSNRTKTHLQVALKRRLRSGRPTLLSFTSTKVTRQIKSLLPSAREWTIAAAPAPDPVERMLVISQMAAVEGLHLSPTLVRLIAFRMKGNGRTLSGALKRLRLLGNAWTEPRQILRGCGALDPFLSDNSAWDLGDLILRAAEGQEFQNSEANPSDLALYTMLRVAGLSESAVARSFGIQPAEAYATAERIELQASASESARKLSRRFLECVVENLSID